MYISLATPEKALFVYVFRQYIFILFIHVCILKWKILQKSQFWRQLCAFDNSVKLWCWRRLLRVPWTARRSNQSIPKKINHEYSLEALMLKRQYFGHLMWKAYSLEKTLMLGKIKGRKRKEWQRMRWLNGITDSTDLSFEYTLLDSEGQGSLACCSPWSCTESDMT